ncbi:SRPBCC family protein [Colwellia psychrerythraea]|uniref:Polyketide cyclase/dehydrase n=1 Tax=Colwellia psychrerythraea TaxID=28229 RepID=A0A099KVV8_COLPS|nr:SRPBCC family protein [Colwellia psychrerythraea]KGJ93788.1 Polyketide cyclase/dehydrase [Colwellia psychrerythraea]
MKIDVEIEIASPKSSVWAAITDIKNCAEMISGIKELTVIHQPEQGLVGLKWKETREMFGKQADETMWITESEEESYYCTRAENSGAIYLSTLAVSEASYDNTLLTMSFSATSNSLFVRAVSAIMAMFIKKSMRTMLEKDLSDIKTYIENEIRIKSETKV